ncbi:helix-turn-helix domain-containing protein [Dysgonomonas sp.]
MECLYQKEHAGCINFVLEEEEPAIKITNMDKGDCIHEQPGLGQLVILLRGKISISYSLYDRVLMTSRQMFFLPVNYGINFSAEEVSCLVLIRLDHKIHFCDSFMIEQLSSCIQAAKLTKGDLSKPCVLPVKAILRSILHQTKEVSDAGYSCRVYFEKKVEELFMMMRFCYTKEQLACFFKEIISADSHFAYKVIHNYHYFRTVSELSVFMGLTLQSFDRRFQRIFGQSGYKWMNERRKQKIYRAITSQNESFKELSFQLGFSSPAAFNGYCKLYLGNTPGKIRMQAKTMNPE